MSETNRELRKMMQQQTCKHRFLDTKHCVYCGWIPPTEALAPVTSAAPRQAPQGSNVLRETPETPAPRGETLPRISSGGYCARHGGFEGVNCPTCAAFTPNQPPPVAHKETT